jgi:hypothetical protein
MVARETEERRREPLMRAKIDQPGETHEGCDSRDHRRTDTAYGERHARKRRLGSASRDRLRVAHRLGGGLVFLEPGVGFKVFTFSIRVTRLFGASLVSLTTVVAGSEQPGIAVNPATRPRMTTRCTPDEAHDFAGFFT